MKMTVKDVLKTIVTMLGFILLATVLIAEWIGFGILLYCLIF